MDTAFRVKINVHVGGSPPVASADDKLWSSAELAEAIGDRSVLDVPLPALAEEEAKQGKVAGWKKTTTPFSGAFYEKRGITYSIDRWYLGKWDRQSPGQKPVARS